MEQKINEIKGILQAASINELPAFIDRYSKDARAGVQTLLKKAQKRISDYKKELERTEKMKEFEKEYCSYAYICGIDEVGRGPLAGPVVAGAVILPKDCDILYLNDSKQLTEKKREELYDEIMEKAQATGLGFVSPERIDEINILQATYEAMREAVSKLHPEPDLLL
ncbi:MAG: ribonuclease HII, partial [Lachnospiraceae bacterium]|nr:ribonuclease HII [Lachnospiraceae bacterium]